MNATPGRYRNILRQLLLVLALFILCIMAGAGCLMLLSKGIYNANGCDRFNIDNVELRTGLDVPALRSYTCSLDTLAHTKQEVFLLDGKKVNMIRYLERNHFRPLPAGAAGHSAVFDRMTPLPADSSLQYAQGHHRDGDWEAFLQSSTATLWVKISFADR